MENICDDASLLLNKDSSNPLQEEAITIPPVPLNSDIHDQVKIVQPKRSNLIERIEDKAKICCSNLCTGFDDLTTCENSEITFTAHTERCTSTTSTGMCTRTEGRIRKELKYFFMNPCQKYKARKRKPFKLTIQIFKIALVTIQLLLYGANNQEIVGFMNDNLDVLNHNLLINQSAIFTRQSLYKQINHIRKKFNDMENSSIGLYEFAPVDNSHLNCDLPLKYKNGEPKFILMAIDQRVISDECNSKRSSIWNCFVLKAWNKTEHDSYSLLETIPLYNGSIYHIDFARLNKLQLHFGLKTQHLWSSHSYYKTECYNITTTVTLDNSAHSGKILQSLSTEFYLTEHDCDCNEDIIPTFVVILSLDIFIILICFISILLCSRSLWRAQRLRKSFERFYLKNYQKRLDWWTKFEFFNGWYFLIIISDILTISGSITKILNQFQNSGVVNYDVCSLFLGIGCLFVWVGVLRFVGYFHQYNLLVLTLKKSTPHVLRFMVCASLLYIGFVFCGWIVLGPYHHKFRSLIVTSEALYSLINGDDMYMTFEEMSKTSSLAWGFSQIYLYVFISLFIYMVLSLFIAVIMETYETIKEWQENGFPPQSQLQIFIAEGESENEDFSYFASDTYCCCCLYHNNDPDIVTDEETSDDDDPIVS